MKDFGSLCQNELFLLVAWATRPGSWSQLLYSQSDGKKGKGGSGRRV